MGETSLSVNVKSNEILEEKVEDPQREENRKMPLGWWKGWPWRKDGNRSQGICRFEGKKLRVCACDGLCSVRLWGLMRSNV